MFLNYLKIAFRNLLKQKGLAVINILSLSIGLACFVLFLLYSVHEFSYDRFHEDADHIYRVYRWTENIHGDGTEGDPYLPMPLGPALQADLPDVEEALRWKEAWGESFIRVNGKVSREEVSHADARIFRFFSFPLKYGNAETALSDPRNIVLTAETALRLFGEINPTGKTLEIKMEDAFEPFTVSAVAEDLPANSSLQFSVMGSFEYYAGTRHGQSSTDNWGRSFVPTFVRLREGSGLADNAETLLSFRRKYYPDRERELREQGYWKGAGPPVTYRLQPLLEMHTDTQLRGSISIDPKNIWTLLLIAAGVLLIACINFTILAIGRSAGRAREVGVRKVLGSHRRQLVWQFFGEAMLLSVLSAVIGLALGQLLLPYFNEMAGRELDFSLRLYPEIGWMILLLTLVTGLLAGSYPALVLSGFRPLEVLKSKIRLGGSNIFTKSLVTGQFVISIGLIVGTFVILKQLNFLFSRNPGFNRENVIVVDAGETNSEVIFPRFKQTVSSIPQVLGVAGAELGLGAGTGWSRSGWDDNGTHREVFEYFVDPQYLGVMGIQLLTGRNFKPENSMDTTTSVIINEAMMHEFGWTVETALDQTLNGYFDDPEHPQPRVIGVVKDFNFRPFKEVVQPQLFHQFAGYLPYKYFVRLAPGEPSQTLASLEKAWQQVESELPFRYTFLDENLDRFYRAEARFGAIISWAGGLSVFLACLGLLGLASLAVVNRQKEIGIRKVLGASAIRVVALLSRDFLKLVFIALVIASPLAYFFMEKWLQDFAYRIDIQWPVFALAGLAAILIAGLTVSIHSVKAALANPVKSLRSE